MKFVDKDLLSVQEARILMERASEAREALAQFPQEKLDRILAAMLKAVRGQLGELARMSAEETGYGNWRHKYIKDSFVCEALEARLSGLRCVGVLSGNPQAGIAQIGVPLGVIVAPAPAFGPVAAVIDAAALAVKSGNALVISPHPRAERTTRRAVEILAEAAGREGLPEGAIACPDTATREGAAQMMSHPAAALILAAGAPEMLEEAKKSGKPVIFGGTGPSPAFIERTADVKQAAEDIILSRSFDCGTMAASEQYVVVDSAVAEQAQQEMARCGAHFMSGEEEKLLIRLLCGAPGRIDPEYMGKPAPWLAKRAGFAVPEGTRVLVSRQKYVSDHNPYSEAMNCPVLVCYIEQDWIRACEKCMELLVNASRCHTLAIHSGDEAVIGQFAARKPVGRILVNTPAVFGAMGATTNLFPSVHLGAASAGMGITADNVSPMNLVYLRHVARGVRKVPADFDLQGQDGAHAAAAGDRDGALVAAAGDRDGAHAAAAGARGATSETTVDAAAVLKQIVSLLNK